MSALLRLAVSQFPVDRDIAANASYIARHMKRSADTGVQVVHFCEAALSGYAGIDFRSFDGYDWRSLHYHLRVIRRLAAHIKIWVILGSARMVAGEEKPRNCIHVISDTGSIAGSYDKRKLYKREDAAYSAGVEPLVIDIKGMRCGFLICYDSCFPELYEAYRDRGTRLLFHSYYNAKNDGPSNSLDDLILAQLRTRAVDNRLWISASNSSARHSRLASCVARPDGSMRSARRHRPGLVFHDFPDHDLGWTPPFFP